MIDKAMIELRNVEKAYQHGPTKSFVLRRIDVTIKEGEFVSIMGPSGAGKSTLLYVIGMHDSDWTGEYYLMGQPVHKMNRKDRNEVYKQNFGFVFQSYHLLDSLTVAENIEMPLTYRNIKKSDREAIVADVPRGETVRPVGSRAGAVRAPRSFSSPPRGRSTVKRGPRLEFVCASPGPSSCSGCAASSPCWRARRSPRTP